MHEAYRDRGENPLPLQVAVAPFAVVASFFLLSELEAIGQEENGRQDTVNLSILATV